VNYKRAHKEPFILGVIGKSDTGKTTLILKLIPELVKRGYKVGVAKNCPHGFEMDREGKDSWKFSEAGSQGVFLSSPERFALFREEREGIGKIPQIISLFFYGFDIVLMEGYSDLQEVEKIELLRKGISERKNPSSKKVIAFISDIDIKENKPVFRPDEIDKICDFVEKKMEESDTKKNVEITVNGERLPLNFFMQRMIKNLALAIVEPLKRKTLEEDIKEVVIKVNLQEE